MVLVVWRTLSGTRIWCALKTDVPLTLTDLSEFPIHKTKATSTPGFRRRDALPISMLVLGILITYTTWLLKVHLIVEWYSQLKCMVIYSRVWNRPERTKQNMFSPLWIDVGHWPNPLLKRKRDWISHNVVAKPQVVKHKIPYESLVALPQVKNGEFYPIPFSPWRRTDIPILRTKFWVSMLHMWGSDIAWFNLQPKNTKNAFLPVLEHMSDSFTAI